MVEFKIGDIIICKQNCVMENSNIITTSLNISYKIIETSDTDFHIMDDRGYYHSFDFDDISDSYYGIWFYTQKEYRKYKLKKLNGKI